ncbi:MAG: ABC transporter ATP-binding protein [Deltaproteobacteria bacterium]|nr:ABC transporter ATP-binding protein [Deltaproteobacteria bacterium]
MEALRIESLTKQFGGVDAVNRVSFAVSVGERLAIIGPNGAGKTTLFNLINGQLGPTAGRIHFFGRDVTSLPPHRRAHLGQARAFQVISLLQELTVLQNTLLSINGTKPHRFKMFRPVMAFKKVLQKAANTLTDLDLWEKREDPVKNLSYGEQRRLEIGLGLSMDPKLLLLDEPSAGLTKEESADITGIIKNLSSGITVLVVDHDMDMVFEVAERILVLHYGELIADGNPSQIQNDQKVKEIYMGVEDAADYAEID